MIRVDARRIVAFVAYYKTGRYRPIMQFVHCPMSTKLGALFTLDKPVSIKVFGTFPIPATTEINAFDMAPKSDI
jgi:hypothetical protein